jgi:hypothetical protein
MAQKAATAWLIEIESYLKKHKCSSFPMIFKIDKFVKQHKPYKLENARPHRWHKLGIHHRLLQDHQPVSK